MRSKGASLSRSPRRLICRRICPGSIREAKACWNRLAPELVRARCFTLVDQESLAIYCAAWSRWVRCRKLFAKEGESYRTPGGVQRPRPEVAIATGAEATMAKLGDVFGMTPLGRSRLRLPPLEENSEGDF